MQMLLLLPEWDVNSHALETLVIRKAGEIIALMGGSSRLIELVHS